MSQWKSGLQVESDTICMGEIEEMPRGKNKRRSCVGKGKQEHDEGESMNVKAEECGTSRKDEVNQDSSNDHANDSECFFIKLVLFEPIFTVFLRFPDAVRSANNFEVR
ncbi:hypothetical protein AB6A40_011027 [Gnathostoma spinigerum]|uniref:Uncharacterized protein n=1 Tax=Gnathostoma spinigerum TaxID=75299 RepID=A0ABD6EX16_9BILA